MFVHLYVALPHGAVGWSAVLICWFGLRYSVDIFFILVRQENWVLTESRIPLKPVLGGVRIVTLCISSHEQTKNRVCCFLIV